MTQVFVFQVFFKNPKKFFIIIFIFRELTKIKKKKGDSLNSSHLHRVFSADVNKNISNIQRASYEEKYISPSRKFNMFLFNHFTFCISTKEKKNVRPQYIQDSNPVFTLKTLARGNAHTFFFVMDSESKKKKRCSMFTNYFLKTFSFVLQLPQNFE